jgi:predicted RNA-binding Zn-ribbon protein involved in translation (DUF1610 family)
MASSVCRACGAALSIDEPIGRDAECPSCGHDVRACVNCRHYDTRYNNACMETEAEPVEDKHRRNFCEFFSLSREPYAGKGGQADRERAARAGLDKLFGGSGAAPDRATDARKKLDALFGGVKKDDEDDDA